MAALAVACMIQCTGAKAAIKGAALHYTYVSGNTYQINLELYVSCGSLTGPSMATFAASTPSICIYNDSISVDTVTLNPPTNAIIEYMCVPGLDSSSCTSTSYPYPGIEKFIYTGNYTVPFASHCWRFIFSGNIGTETARLAAAVTNIAGSGAVLIQLTDTLDNFAHNNSSPTIHQEPKMTYCDDSEQVYDPMAVDPDGDSLAYHFAGVMNGSGNCATPGTAAIYDAAYTSLNPLGVPTYSTLGSLNVATGQLSLFAIAGYWDMVFYNIDEYRHDTLIGTSQKLFTVQISPTCSATCIDTIALSTTIPSSEHEPMLYPNPATNVLRLSGCKQFRSLIISNLYGQTIVNDPVTTDAIDLDLSRIPSGIYFVHLNGEMGTVIKKFVKL